MVLVSDQPSNNIGILQTKLGRREGHEARRGGLETMPLDQYVEGGHGEREPGVKIRPDPVHDFLQVAHNGQHREHCLHQHPVLRCAALTQFEVGRIALRGMEGGITQDNHTFFELSNEPLKSVIRDIGGGTLPSHDQPSLIEQETEFAADNPAMIREAFAADLLRAPTLSDGVDQLNAIRIDAPEYGWGGQESLRPVLMGPEEAKEPRPLREVGKQRAIIRVSASDKTGGCPHL